MKTSKIDILILIGRPASGKSEIIDFLTHLPSEEREQRFHLGDLTVFDDFPMLWTWFEEDAIISGKFGKPRLHTEETGDFKYRYLWDLLIERLALEYHKLSVEKGPAMADASVIIEFSRGTEHGGYTSAFQHFPTDILERARILYVNVTFEESLRKNRRRFNPNKPHSILEHGLPDERLEKLYKEDDWLTLVDGNTKGYLELENSRVPYVIFENNDDVTTGKPEQLAERLEDCLGELAGMANNRE